MKSLWKKSEAGPRKGKWRVSFLQKEEGLCVTTNFLGSHAFWCRARGISLIELMVSILLGAVAVAMMMDTAAMQDRARRAIIGRNEAGQAEAYVLYLFGDLLRNAAGNLQQSGSAESLNKVAVPTGYGCLLHSPVLPSGANLGSTSQWPSSFRSLAVSNSLRLAPVLVQSESANAPHKVVVFRGGPSLLGTTISVQEENSSGVLTLSSSFGLSSGEWVLGVEGGGVAAFGSTCSIAKVASLGTPAPSSNGSETVEVGLDKNFSFGWVGRSISGTLSSLGKTPNVVMYGIDGQAHRLVSFDLFDTSNQLQKMLDNVVTLRVLYGIDNGSVVGGVQSTATDGVVDLWTLPEGLYSYAELTNGTPQAAERIRRITALRLGLVTSLPVSTGQTAAGVEVSARLFDGITGVKAETYQPLRDGERARAFEWTAYLRSASLAGAYEGISNQLR